MKLFRQIIIAPGKNAFIFLLLLISIDTANAQQVNFNRVFTPEPSYYGLINDIDQDSKGYMWFATSGRGLHRYDGYHLVTYVHDKLNRSSLGLDRLREVCADRNDIIWIGTEGAGLDRLDPQTGVFTHFQHTIGDKNSLSDDNVTAIQESHDGAIWIGTQNGLNRFDQRTGKFTQYYFEPGDTTSLGSNFVQVLYEDPQHTLWVGTRSLNVSSKELGGLNRLNNATGKFVRYQHDPGDQHSLNDNNVGAIFEDSKGVFWISTAKDGMNIMDRKQGTFERLTYDPARPSRLTEPQRRKGVDLDLNLFFICEDGTGIMWFGSSGGWITRYDRETKKATHYYSINNDEQAAESLSGGFKSREGVLWITTWSGNIYRVDPFHSNIPYHPTGSIVHAIHEDVSGTLWIGTLFKGLIRYNQATGSIRRFLSAAAGSDKVHDAWIPAFYEEGDDSLWIGTGAGMYLLEKKKQKFKRYQNEPGNENSLSKGAVLDIMEDRPGYLWLATRGGLDHLEIKTGVVKHFRTSAKDGDSLQNNDFSALLKDHNGNLWLGTWNGYLYRFDPKTEKFQHYECGSLIGSLFEDHDNIVWAGTSTGLYRSNVAADTFSRFMDAEVGLTQRTIIAGILEDNQNNLWVSCTAGILRFNEGRNEIRVYNINQGVDASGLSFPLMRGERTKNGALFFGHRTGYYAFYPEQLKSNTTPPQVVISNFSLADQPVKPGKGSPLSVPIYQTKQIKLRYNQNFFSFDFTGIHYSSPEDNQHLYMLENLDNTWRKAGPEKRAYYHNVSPGQYRFRVKVSNSYGIWAERSILIIITPPWWSKWWVQALVVLVLIASLYALIRRRFQQKFRNQLDRSEKERQFAELQHKTAELEMQALRAQMNPHFIFNSLNSVNMFILENNKSQASEYLSKFSRLVRLILHHSRESFIPLDRELEALRLYLELESLRFEKRFDYKISVRDVDTIMAKLPPLIIQPYAENAIWHGLMQKKEKGHLEIEIYGTEKILFCKITDDGIGRERAADLKSKSSLPYKSMGMRITADRLAMLQQQEKIETSIFVKDLVYPDGSAAGTEVLIKLPLHYD